MFHKRFFSFSLIIFVFFSTLSEALAENAFATNSVLASGNWVKIRVKESGICKITHEQLKQWGFSSPADIRIYGYGGAMLSEDLSKEKIDDLNEIPLYDGGTYFLFYAQGPTQWNHVGSVYQLYSYSINPYSQYGYYFLTDSKGEKKRMSIRPEIELDTTGSQFYLPHDINNFLDYQIHKNEEFNYCSSGKTWYGDRMTMGQTKTWNFYFPDRDTSKSIDARVVTASYSLGSDADLKFSVGDTTIERNLTYNYCSGHVSAATNITNLTTSSVGEKVKIALTYNSTSSSENLSVERIIVTAYRSLSLAETTTLFFRYPYAFGKSDTYTYHISNCNSDIQIWDISESSEPLIVSTQREGTTLSFQDFKEVWPPRQYVAIDVKNPDYITAEKVGTVSNQNLHAESDIDLVIVTHPDLMEGAEHLAKIHEEYDGMNVLVTTQEKIFNEFSSGTPDATAIRWFMKMLYERNGKKPFYLLLLGDGSYDNRGILASSSVTVNNMILTYQGGSSVDESSSYTSDDYFAFLDDDEISLGNVSAAKMDINVGRIPATNMTELNAVISKIEAHIQNKNYGKWKNRIVLLADDNEESSAYQKFCEYSDNLAKKVNLYNPAMDVKKLYLDAYTRTTGSNGSRYYEVEDLIKEEVGNGVFFFNYVGHSSIIGFSAEHVFTQNTARTIYNENCGFWFTASCQFAQYDGFAKSGGEDLLLNPNGGALGLVSSARVVFDNRNDNLNQAFFTHLFERDSTGMPLRIGDVVRLSKQKLPNDSNKLAFCYLGDPTLRLHYPSEYVMTDSIKLLNGEHTDTLNALSEVKVFGHISDKDSIWQEGFNGTVFVTVYDKEMTLYTKANIYTEEADIIAHRHTYTDRPNVLFSGQVEVVNGQFSVTFKIPKDINYSYGSGRIAYYAYDEENGYEAQGDYEAFTIGGSCDEEISDEEGPSITLYMNRKGFKSGDKVNSSPVFYAKVSDENGINASGCGIGHDITLTKDGTSINLNNYFAYEKDSYTDGTVTYQFSDLEDGTYTYMFKVWDLLNNSSSQEFTFKVDHTLNAEIDEFVVYPNPAKEEITLRMTHSQPKTVQTFRFLLYDINGSVIYQTDEITAKNDGSYTWTWDLTTQNGRRIAPGCYIARAEIQQDGEKYVGETKKIIVLPQ